MTSAPTADARPAGAGASLRDLQRIPAVDLEALLGVRLLPSVLRYAPDRDRLPLASAQVSWLHVCETTAAHHEHAPALTTGWPDRWSITFSNKEGE